MNETQRNTRTLIVSFVIAVMALVPLRLIEIGNVQNDLGGTVVLGDEIEVNSTDWIFTTTEEYTEPETEQQMSVPVFEAPYAEVDGQGCLSEELVEEKSTALIEEIDSGKINYNQIQINLSEIEKLQSLVCRS